MRWFLNFRNWTMKWFFWDAHTNNFWCDKITLQLYICRYVLLTLNVSQLKLEQHNHVCDNKSRNGHSRRPVHVKYILGWNWHQLWKSLNENVKVITIRGGHCIRVIQQQQVLQICLRGTVSLEFLTFLCGNEQKCWGVWFGTAVCCASNLQVVYQVYPWEINGSFIRSWTDELVARGSNSGRFKAIWLLWKSGYLLWLSAFAHILAS
jgi:hypothetical protein